MLKKAPYYIAVNRNYLPVDLMMKHNLSGDRIYRKQDKESIIAEEFFDLTLEVAAYARKHLQLAREI